MIVVGAAIPPADVPTLIAEGAAAVFGPGTNIPKAAAELVGKLNEKMGMAGRARRRRNESRLLLNCHKKCVYL